MTPFDYYLIWSRRGTGAWLFILAIMLAACGGQSRADALRAIPPPAGWRTTAAASRAMLSEIATALNGAQMPHRVEMVFLEADPNLRGDVTVLIYPDDYTGGPGIFDIWSGEAGHSLTDAEQIGRATFQSTADPTLWQIYWHRCNIVARVSFPSTVDAQAASAYSRRVDEVLAAESDC